MNSQYPKHIVEKLEESFERVDSVIQTFRTASQNNYFKSIVRVITDDSSAEVLGLCLLARGITQPELELLGEKILNHEWEKIRLVSFHCALSALSEYDMLRPRHARKYQVNDEIDRFRISTALHCRSLVIGEKAMSLIVRRLESEIGQKFEVYAVDEGDEIKAVIEQALVA